MIILTIRTDKPEAEIGLFDDETRLVYETWPAHRELSDTLHTRIKRLLDGQRKDWRDIQGVVAYLGPGSFTGLRIGLSVANALSESLSVPIAGSRTDDWLRLGIDRLMSGGNDSIALPEYGAPVHITKQKH